MNMKFIQVPTNMTDIEVETTINIEDISSMYPSMRWDRKQKGYRPAIFILMCSGKTFYTVMHGDEHLYKTRQEALPDARKFLEEFLEEIKKL